MIKMGYANTLQIVFDGKKEKERKQTNQQIEN